MAMATFTPITFYLGLTIQDMLDYIEIIDEMNKKTRP